MRGGRYGVLRISHFFENVASITVQPGFYIQEFFNSSPSPVRLVTSFVILPLALDVPIYIYESLFL